MSTFRKWWFILFDDDAVVAPFTPGDRHKICVPAVVRLVSSVCVRSIAVTALSRSVLVPEQERC